MQNFFWSTNKQIDYCKSCNILSSRYTK
ncbi:MAG: type I-B CRISPR-associated protein Cas8b1/Cst1 [Firmicutes bacterium]|nr:type I-B CRISPR-associated protein Cas8b1/Cst1 [Bacillota bacterium]